VDSSVYRTESGLILRIIEADDGGIKVEQLEGDAWVAGRIGMVGLRLSSATTKLTNKQISALPE
jgi:hypothetical protein